MTLNALTSDVEEPAAVRLGLTFPGDPGALTSWSGTPAGLSGGLRACGVDVSEIGVRLPDVLHKAVLGGSAVSRVRPSAHGASSELRSAFSRARVAPGQGRLETLMARRRLRGDV